MAFNWNNQLFCFLSLVYSLKIIEGFTLAEDKVASKSVDFLNDNSKGEIILNNFLS